MSGDSDFVIQMDPQYLFSFKGTRDRVLEKYHKHEYPEIAFVMSGKGKYRIDGTIYNIEEGDILILNAGVLHQYDMVDEPNPTTEFFVGFTGFQFRDYEPDVIPLINGEPVVKTSGELKQKFFRLCSQIEAETSDYREGRSYMLKSYGIQLLMLMARIGTEPVSLGGTYQLDIGNKKKILEYIMNYFEEHYNEKISLERLAGSIYMSPFYLSRVFKAETGDTPIKHLTKIRLEKAREILLSGNVAGIQEVAAAVGYDDSYYFSKLYKKYYGETPTQTRREGRS